MNWKKNILIRIFEVGYLASLVTLAYVTPLIVLSECSFRTPRIVSQDDVHQRITKLKIRLGIPEDVEINCELDYKVKYSTSYSEKLDDKFYEVYLHPNHYYEGILRHEMEHISSGVCDEEPGILHDIKYYLIYEPRATLCEGLDICL